MYRAIIIDDEKWVVKSLIATLKDMEHFQIVAELNDGLSALRYLKEYEPDLAFVDVRLPGMNGLEILREANSLGLRTLFIVISGHAEFAYAQKAMLHNAIGYCLKPFSYNELSDAVNKAWILLQKRHQTESVPTPAVLEAAPAAATKNKAVSSMLDYIHEHYMEDISIQTLADLCSINPNYAGQLFKQKVNQTFNSYLSNLRIQQAIHLLTNTDMPVSFVAAAVGYQDYFYFAKVFKKLTGSTPSSYRQEDEPEDC